MLLAEGAAVSRAGGIGCDGLDGGDRDVVVVDVVGDVQLAQPKVGRGEGGGAAAAATPSPATAPHTG